MRELTILTLLSLTLALPAWAIVEPQLAGDWSDGARTWHIDASGSYRTINAGKVVETGTLTALDGKWNLRSDTGRLDSGSFSLIGSELVLRSSITSTTSWKRSSAASISSTQMATLPVVKPDNRYSGLSNNLSINKPSTSVWGGLSPNNQTQQRSAVPIQSGIASNTTQQPQYSQPGAESRRGEFRREVRNSFRKLINSAQQAQTGGPTGAFGFSSSNNNSSPPGGHGSYSEMRKAFEQEQINSLPPPSPIGGAPGGDETSLYGVTSFEAKARGPTRAVRIKVF